MGAPRKGGGMDLCRHDSRPGSPPGGPWRRLSASGDIYVPGGVLAVLPKSWPSLALVTLDLEPCQDLRQVRTSVGSELGAALFGMRGSAGLGGMRAGVVT